MSSGIVMARGGYFAGCNAKNDPRGQKFADATRVASRTRTKEGRTRGKRDSPERPMGLCKRDIKISLQIASTTFPFRSQSAYRIEVRETDCSCRLAHSRALRRRRRRCLFVSLSRTSTRLFGSSERDFSANVAFLTANRFNCHENIVPLIVMILDVSFRELMSRRSS